MKDFLNTQANRRLGQLGLTDRMIRDVKREAWWWLKARGSAIRHAAGLRRGSTIVLTEPGRCELVSIDEPAAGPGEITVSIEASVVSPGTERAQYLRLPNADVRYPHRPGYSAAGLVVDAGRNVDGLRPGDRVALSCPHASVATVPASSVFAVPEHVPLASAAAVQLGVIAAQGIRRADLRPGEPVCVIGAGIVGSLALRLARAAGAGPAVAVAASRRRERSARAGGAERFLVADEDAEEIGALGVPLVIEATGEPAAIALATKAAGADGRIVLLGSPRAVTPSVPVDAIRSKRLALIGAHISTIGRGGHGPDSYRRLGQDFIDALADRSLEIADLVEGAVDPREAARFYRELAGGALVGGRFDWTALSRCDRIRRTSFARLPDMTARGVEYGRRPLLTAPRESSWTHHEDPFAHASGRLRIGLLGCGDIAVDNAAGIQIAPNTELVACFDPIRTLAEDLARRFGGTAVDSADALLDRSDVDAVFVAVPHHLHAPLARQAMEAGKHVIVEKPPANSLQAAVEMAATARRAGVVVSVCFPQRFQSSVVAAKHLIATGALGPFTGSTISFLADRPASYWFGGFSARSPSDWRQSRERAGGGVLIMNLSHYIDLVRHLVGIEVESVMAYGASFDGREVEDAISIAFRYQNGALGSLVGSTAVRGTYGGQTSTEVRLWGEDGHVSVERGLEVFTLRAVEGLRPTRWQRFRRLPGAQIRAVYVSRLATAIDRGEAVDVTAEDGLAVQAFIEAAYLSRDLSRAVSPAELLQESGA